MLLCLPENVQLFADYIVCILWAAAYFSAFISTIKEKKPAIPPYATVFILPWELLGFLQSLPWPCTPISFGRRSWFIFHLGVFIIGIYKMYRKKTKIIISLITLFVTLTVVLYFVFQTSYGQLYTSLINSILCWLPLLYYVAKPGYPPSRYNLAFAIFGFLADAAALLVYLDEDYFTCFLCIALEIIQFIHVILAWRVLKKANVKLIESPEVMRRYVIKRKADFRSYMLMLNKYLKSKLLPESNNQNRRKYKKKTKNKKTHRKK